MFPVRLLALGFLPFLLSGADLKLVSVRKIWDKMPHNAFGDLTRFHESWWCVFREGYGHIPSKTDGSTDGKLRVIVSKDGDQWESAAVIEEPGVDLRDPHLSITADGRLMVVAGGSRYKGTEYLGRRPRVMFSADGREWTKPQAVLDEGKWLWRVTWHDGRAWGVAKYGSPSKEMADNPRRVNLVTSRDGVKWETVTELKVPGGDETTLRFHKDGTMVALMRRTWTDGNLAAIGHAKPPYRKWSWMLTEHFVGGPNFIVLPDGQMIAGGRNFEGGYGKDPRMALGSMDLSGYEPALSLPSGGDTSYPGFAWHDGLLWTMYYASHEGSTAIYLAKIQVTPVRTAP